MLDSLELVAQGLGSALSFVPAPLERNSTQVKDKF